MKPITIEEARRSLIEQIKERLSDNSFDYSFEEHEQEDVQVTLLSGQTMPCMSVELKDEGQLVFSVSIVNVQVFEVGASDLTLESLDKIRETIKVNGVLMDIWASNDSDEQGGDNHTLLYSRRIKAMPTKEDAIDRLKEIIPCEWMAAPDFGENRYVYYPEAMDKEHYLIAHFD